MRVCFVLCFLFVFFSFFFMDRSTDKPYHRYAEDASRNSVAKLILSNINDKLIIEHDLFLYLNDKKKVKKREEFTACRNLLHRTWVR